MWFVLQSWQCSSQTWPRCQAARSASWHAFSNPQNSPREVPVRSPSLTSTKSTTRKVPVSSCSTKPCDPSLCSRRHVLMDVTIAHFGSQQMWLAPSVTLLFPWSSSHPKSSPQLTIPLTISLRRGEIPQPQPLSGQRCAGRRALPKVQDLSPLHPERI